MYVEWLRITIITQGTKDDWHIIAKRELCQMARQKAYYVRHTINRIGWMHINLWIIFITELQCVGIFAFDIRSSDDG